MSMVLFKCTYKTNKQNQWPNNYDIRNFPEIFEAFKMLHIMTSLDKLLFVL